VTWLVGRSVAPAILHTEKATAKYVISGPLKTQSKRIVRISRNGSA
jgi:hypothetical protein